MPIRSRAQAAGILGPEDLNLLGRVFQATEIAGETAFDREDRAFRLIHYFQSGITDEAQLREMVAPSMPGVKENAPSPADRRRGEAA